MTTSPERTTARHPRYHEVDALRSTLMLLGVVFHAASVYAVHEHWLVKSPRPSFVFDLLAWGVHLFRLPAFFVVSGFFSAMLLRRWSGPVFLRDRARRLGLPLVTTLLTVNLLEFAILHRGGAAGAAPVGAALAAAWRDGNVLGHLWFLVYLLAYCALLTAVAPALRGAPAARVRAALARRGAMVALALLWIAAGIAPPVAGHLSGGALDQVLLGIVTPNELLRFLPVFAVGVLLQAEPTALERFSRLGPGTVAAGVLAGAAGVVLRELPGPVAKIATYAAYLTFQWVIVRGVFAAFRRLASRPSPTFAYLADASYSVYLLHHVLVVGVATALLGTGWAPGWQFSAVLATAAAVPLAIHHLVVRRSRLAALLVNGKSLAARPAPAAVPAAGEGAVPGSRDAPDPAKPASLW